MVESSVDTDNGCRSSKKINQFPFVLKASPIANRPTSLNMPEFEDEISSLTNTNIQNGNTEYGSS